MKTMTLLYCVFYLSILHLFSSVLSAEIINNEPVIKELPLRYKKTIDLNYDDVSTEFLINDLNKRYNLFLKPNFVYEKMQEIEVNGKVYRLPETFLDEEAMRMPVSIHLADVPYWKMVAEVAKSTNSRLHIDREVVYFDKSDRYYSLGNSYTTAGIYLISLKKDEQSHAVLEFVSFRQDIGDDGELKLDKVTINYQGIKKDVSGSIEEWNTPSGLFLKWISNDPVEFKEGMILSGDILGEVVTKRYYINNLLGDTVLEKNNLKVKVKTTNYEDLGSTTKFGFIKIQPGQALWTIRVLLKDVSEYGLTKEEYQFIKECFIEDVNGKKRENQYQERYEQLAHKVPRLRFDVRDEMVPVWYCETDKGKKHCEKCAADKHASVYEEMECKFEKQKGIDSLCSTSGLEVEVKIRNFKSPDTFPVGLIVHEYQLQNTCFQIKVEGTIALPYRWLYDQSSLLTKERNSCKNQWRERAQPHASEVSDRHGTKDQLQKVKHDVKIFLINR